MKGYISYNNIRRLNTHKSCGYSCFNYICCRWQNWSPCFSKNGRIQALPLHRIPSKTVIKKINLNSY